MIDVEIKPGQYAVKGDKKRKVLAVNGGEVTLYNDETHTEFVSKVSQLLASGYAMVDPVDAPEKEESIRSVAASSVDASTLTVPADGDLGYVDQSVSKEQELFSVAGENNAANENGDPVPAADVSAGQRRVRTPEEILGDLKRRQEEAQAKMIFATRRKSSRPVSA